MPIRFYSIAIDVSNIYYTDYDHIYIYIGFTYLCVSRKVKIVFLLGTHAYVISASPSLKGHTSDVYFKIAIFPFRQMYIIVIHTCTYF